MDLMMCTSCGTFVKAMHEDGTLAPLQDSCPDCEGTAFEDTETGEVVRTADRSD